MSVSDKANHKGAGEKRSVKRQINRLAHIIAELRNGSAIALDLALDLDVSEKTINRDMQTLRELGFKIDTCCTGADVRGYLLAAQLVECCLCGQAVRRLPRFRINLSITEDLRQRQREGYDRYAHPEKYA